jgi:tetratricopeptide (TPR) repeat protein
LFGTARDYTDMAELAMRAGFPAEAKNTLDQGFQVGVLGSGADAARHKRLRDTAAKAMADDEKTMTQGEAEAKKSKDGTGLVNLGYAYVTAGQADKGLGMMEQGIRNGGLKYPEEARLHLAVAYAKAGKKAEALQTLQSIKGSDSVAELARYWTLHLKQAA